MTREFARCINVTYKPCECNYVRCKNRKTLITKKDRIWDRKGVIIDWVYREMILWTDRLGRLKWIDYPTRAY